MPRAVSPTPIDDRLLDVAVEQFGRNGPEGASTRSIAAAAGTAMSSITYHFGGKDGLYLAAARHIGAQINAHMATGMARPRAIIADNDTPDAALEAALGILGSFINMMVRTESAAWASFIVREQMEPTGAFDILYDMVMGPMTSHFAELLQRASDGALDAGEARLQTMAMIGQVLFFRVCRATALRVAGWTDIGPAEADHIHRTLRANLRAIIASPPGDSPR